ncbi:response regulator, partial [Escherichia coli]|uniref:response regulator n=1 Tax=Escherichia coli TaxID=562 RepID=UPI001909876F
HQAAAFVRAAPRMAPGCILIDARKPDRMGMSVQESIRGAGFNWPVVGIVSEGDVQTTVAVLKSGAQTVVEAPVDGESLNNAIREAARRLAEIDDSEEVRRAGCCPHWSVSRCLSSPESWHSASLLTAPMQLRG